MPAELPADIRKRRQNLNGLGVSVAEELLAQPDGSPVRRLSGSQASLSLIDIGETHVKPAAGDRGLAVPPLPKDTQAERFRLAIAALAQVQLDEARGDREQVCSVARRPLLRRRDSGPVSGFGEAEISEASGGDGCAMQQRGIVRFKSCATTKSQGGGGEVTVPQRLASFQQ